MEDDYWVPRNLDAPALFFMWELDTAIVIIVCFVLGGVLNMALVGVVLAIVIGRGYTYLKEEGGRGLLIKVAYWYTPSDVWLSKRAPSHIREYIGE